MDGKVALEEHFSTPMNNAHWNAAGEDEPSADRVLFSADYPYEQMDMGARWFDDMRLTNALKAQGGRRNADRLFGLKLAKVSDDAAAGFGS